MMNILFIIGRVRKATIKAILANGWTMMMSKKSLVK
jgi:hypothetical protein